MWRVSLVGRHRYPDRERRCRVIPIGSLAVLVPSLLSNTGASTGRPSPPGNGTLMAAESDRLQ